MEWVYKNEKYITEPFKIWYSQPYHLQMTDYNILRTICENGGLVYHTKWNRLYNLMTARLAGNGHRLKAWIEDIHTKKQYVCQLQDLEIVTKIK